MGHLHPSLDELFAATGAGRVARSPLAKSADSLSGSPFERVHLDGVPHVLKHVGHDLDWLMRALGDGRDGRVPWAGLVWRDGLLDRLPPEIDHTVVGMAYDSETARLSVLMRDVADALVPPGDGALPLPAHRRFLDHMAAMHAAFWGFQDEIGLLPPGARYTGLTRATGRAERATGGVDPVPLALEGGWDRLAEAAPAAHAVAAALAADPGPLSAALARTPATFIHGDWKAGNLGAHPDGRTVLLDWGWPGRDGPCVDLAWYLAVNCDRLPESKEDTVDAFRSSLVRRDVPTDGWWDSQLELALLGAFVQLGWSKTGNPEELAWWTGRIMPTARSLGVR
jgi:hypothetical protein